jgi:hypothetical protein
VELKVLEPNRNKRRINQSTHLVLSHHIGGLGALNRSSNAKVNQLELISDHEEVGRLEVRVDDTMLVDTLYRFKHLVK